MTATVKPTRALYMQVPELDDESIKIVASGFKGRFIITFEDPTGDIEIRSVSLNELRDKYGDQFADTVNEYLNPVVNSAPTLFDVAGDIIKHLDNKHDFMGADDPSTKREIADIIQAEIDRRAVFAKADPGLRT